MPPSPTFFTIGYGRWPAKTRQDKFVPALKAAGVDLLVDIRHSPCSSQVDPASNYGPTAMNLRATADNAGIVPMLSSADIQYFWCLELGNPQKNDPRMVVLKEHLTAPPSSGWPVHRGLEIIKGFVLGGRRLAMMCACDHPDECHRKPVAEALLKILPADSTYRDLSR